MSNQNDQDRQHDIREKIASQIQAAVQAPNKQIPTHELQKLKSAVTRLNQLLNASATADHQALKTAVARLDQLLVDIGRGNDVTHVLKRRGRRQSPKD